MATDDNNDGDTLLVVASSSCFIQALEIRNFFEPS